MGIPAVRPEKEISYEEQRAEDYLKAYTTTGKPPEPCPQQPASAEERIRLGLPPLFQPYVEVPQGSSLGPNLALNDSTVQQRVQYTNLQSLPTMQVFTHTKVNEEGSTFMAQSIVFQDTFAHFSFEELRDHAYRSGKKIAPEAIRPGLSLSISQPQLSIKTQPTLNGQLELYQSISCTEPYAKHSFEELRLAYLRSGRSLTSDEILKHNAVLHLAV